MYSIVKRLIYFVLPLTVIDALKVKHFYRIFDHFENGDFPESTIFLQLLMPGDTVIDVGANIGLVTKLFMRMVGDSGSVHSFEPVPYTYKILTNNIQRSGAQNVVCYDCAISDQDGTATIEVPTYADVPAYTEAQEHDNSGSLGRVRNYYAAQISRNAPQPGGGRISYEIKTRSLDHLFPEPMPRISFIKCDAEGFELECMRGAKAILERDRPPLYIEICSDPDKEGTGMWQVNNLLSGLGYSPYIFQDGKLQTRPTGMFVHDLFYLTEEQHAVAVLNPTRTK